MATVISKDEAYAHLSDVIDRAMRGEEIEIEQGGLVKLKLVPISPEGYRRESFGFLKGKLSVPPSSFEPLPEDELRAWEGH